MESSNLDKYFDTENPLSLYNMLPESLQLAIRAVDVDTFNHQERKLREVIKPTDVDYTLRYNFWTEANRLMQFPTEKSVLHLTRIYGTVCTGGYFKTRTSEKHWLAWFLKPLRSFEQTVENMLFKAMERYEEILEMDITKPVQFGGKGEIVKDDKGKNIREVCPTKAKVLLAAIMNVENRARGMAVQRIKSESLNVNANASLPEVENPKVIDERIRKLEARIRGQVTPELVEAAVTEEDVAEIIKEEED